MKRLQELREAKKFSQRKLAAELNLSQAVISKYELGQSEPNIATIVNIAQYFGVTTDYLLENPSPAPTVEGDLSIEEIDLLTDYRKLNPLKKQNAAAFIKGLSVN